MSVRTEPRLTRDADLAVLVSGDRDAEALVHDLQGRGWRVATAIEQDVARRLATVRLALAGADVRGAVIDLLFASSGIEPEIVAAADLIEAIPGFTVPEEPGYFLRGCWLDFRGEGSAGVMSVLPKSSPLKSSGSAVALARA